MSPSRSTLAAQVGAGPGGRLGQGEGDGEFAWTAGITNLRRCSSLTNRSTERQVPLTTWTIIRIEACDIEKSSISSK